MLILRNQGLYCPAGDFYIDPKGKVERAVVTHSHSDHARRGATQYYTVAIGVGLLKARLGQKISVSGHEYGEIFHLGPVKVSFHPAGHILGSAQVRIEHGGEVWVASGDYKRDPDPTCAPFESVPCDVFVTEATFGTPAYRWPKGSNLGQEIFQWWEMNRADGVNSVIFAYSLGKTQRILGELAGVLAEFPGRVVHCAPAATPLVECYRQEGVALAPTVCLGTVAEGALLDGALVLVPQSFLRSPLATVLGEDYRTATASGWVSDDGEDFGFVMSDHADWDDLLRTIRESGAKRVYVQHRGQGALVKYLRGIGLEAYPEEELAKGMPPSAQLRLF